jgi:type II secretory ATPase GspE/PulE/Tfp pilus assembly ATPase PilB-like protein
VGLHEQLVATSEIKRLIQQRARITEVAACAQQEGMTTLLQDGVLKCWRSDGYGSDQGWPVNERL